MKDERCPRGARALSKGVNPAVEKFESRKADSGVNRARERASGRVSTPERRFGEVSYPSILGWRAFEAHNGATGPGRGTVAGYKYVVLLKSPEKQAAPTSMLRLLRLLFLLLSHATDRQLARMVEYLKAENRLLRDRLPKRLRVTVQERRRLAKSASAGS